jgi:hypothetical protein
MICVTNDLSFESRGLYHAQDFYVCTGLKVRERIDARALVASVGSRRRRIFPAGLLAKLLAI